MERWGKEGRSRQYRGYYEKNRAYASARGEEDGIARIITVIKAVILIILVIALGVYSIYTEHYNPRRVEQYLEAKLSNSPYLTPSLGVTLIYDSDKKSETYGKVVEIQIDAIVNPGSDLPVDLRKTKMIVDMGDIVVRAKYVDADGDNVFENDACETNWMDAVNYDALTGRNYTAVWILCRDRNEDYMVYPRQIVTLIYKIPEGIEGEKNVTVTIDYEDGAIYSFEMNVPVARPSYFPFGHGVRVGGGARLRPGDEKIPPPSLFFDI